MASYAFIESRIMPKQSVASVTSGTAAVPVGTIVRAKDATLGEGEFIYLQTIASVVAGSLVSWKTASAGSTLAAMQTSLGLGNPLAVATVAGAASNFAWFQISGSAYVKKVASIANANKPVFVATGTTGRIRMLTSATKGIIGMRTVLCSPAATSTVLCTFNRPAMGAA